MVDCVLARFTVDAVIEPGPALDMPVFWRFSGCTDPGATEPGVGANRPR